MKIIKDSPWPLRSEWSLEINCRVCDAVLLADADDVEAYESEEGNSQHSWKVTAYRITCPVCDANHHIEEPVWRTV